MGSKVNLGLVTKQKIPVPAGSLAVVIKVVVSKLSWKPLVPTHSLQFFFINCYKTIIFGQLYVLHNFYLTKWMAAEFLLPLQTV
jgi:hypothetical protein